MSFFIVYATNFEYIELSFNSSLPFKLYTKSTHFFNSLCISNKSSKCSLYVSYNIFRNSISVSGSLDSK